LDNRWIGYLPTPIKKRLEGRINLQVIIANMGWLFFDRILRMGLGLFVGVWVARYLGPEQFGSLNFAIAYVAIFGALSTLGLDGIVVKYVVREPELKFEILSSAFLLRLLSGTLAFIGASTLIFFLRPLDFQFQLMIAIIAFGMIIQSFDIIDLYFQALVKSKYTVIAKNGAFVVSALYRVILILYKAPLLAFAIASLIEIVVGSAGLIVFYVRRHEIIQWRPKVITIKTLLAESWPAILSGLAIMIYMRIDQVMLASMRDNREVGLYSVALRFSEIWYFLPMIIISSVMPSLTNAKQESEQLYIHRLQHMFNALVKFAYVIIIPMTFLSTFLVSGLYGKLYSGAGGILAIHIWSALFVFLGVGMSPWLLNEGLLKLSLAITLSGALLNIILNIFLIPKFGGMGAASATLITQMMTSFVANALIPRLRLIFWMQVRAIVSPFYYKRRLE